MIKKIDATSSPGEARVRERNRKQMLYLAFAGLIGGAAGFLTGFFDRGEGSLFANEWDKLSLDPALAILLAVLLLFGFGFLPLYGFRQIDELKREWNMIGFTGGCLAVLAGFPMWAVLNAGGIGSAPTPFGIWALGFGGMIIAYAYAWWRS